MQSLGMQAGMSGLPRASSIASPANASAGRTASGNNAFAGLLRNDVNGGVRLSGMERMLSRGASLPMQSGAAQLSGGTAAFVPLSGQEVGQSLAQLRLPLTEGNLSLGKSMVECGAPLTRENVTLLKNTLAQLPTAVASRPSSVSAVWFLQSNQLPVTAQNVTVLGNFIASHPQLGQQLFSLQGEFKRVSKAQGGLNQSALETLNQVPGLLGELVPQPGGRKGSKRLFDLARQSGIETNIGLLGGGEPDWELAQLMRDLRESLGDKSSQLQGFFSAAEGLDENVQALRLLNQARPDDGFAYYCLQVPLRVEPAEFAEIWIRYRLNDDGTKVVDSENVRLEFYISTEYLGDLFCTLEIVYGKVSATVSSDNEAVVEYVSEYLPALVERITGLGWAVEKVESVLREAKPHDPVPRASFGSLERVDVQA